MNKDLVLKLIRMANNLDIQGHYKEAGIVDRIVMGQNVETYYSKQIKKYKEYVLKNDVKGATNFFNYVMSYLPPDQQSTFRDQAMRIRLENRFGEYKNYNGVVFSRAQLDNKLNLFELYDKNIDREEFDKRWNAMMFKINQNFDMDLASTRQLQSTYNSVSYTHLRAHETG
jgi:hypothetical protein